MKKLGDYWRVGKSHVLHKGREVRKCYYFLRAKGTANPTGTKKRGDRICDECQRLAKLKK